MKLLTREALREKGIDFSRTHIHRLITAGKFPKPMFLGQRKRVWIEAEIEQWLADRAQERAA